jgi:hypothetical protein
MEIAKWRWFMSYGILRRGDWQRAADVSKERSAFIFRNKQSQSLFRILECEDSMLVQNVADSVPFNMA